MPNFYHIYQNTIKISIQNRCWLEGVGVETAFFLEASLSRIQKYKVCIVYIAYILYIVYILYNYT